MKHKFEVIPKEEQTKCYCGHTTTCDCGPEQDFKDIELPQQERQETLEEVAEKFTPKSDKWTIKQIFIEGAKWQQERSYSEGEVKNLTELFLSYYFKTDKGFDDSFEEWFEQFKKK
jgi:hypothetical protein